MVLLVSGELPSGVSASNDSRGLASRRVDGLPLYFNVDAIRAEYNDDVAVLRSAVLRLHGRTALPVSGTQHTQ